MRRREVILVCAGLAWSSPARAQAPPVVGLLSSRSLVDSERLLTQLHRGLAEHGYVDQRNVLIEYRFGLGQYDRLPALASELVNLSVAVLVTTGGDPTALAAKNATSSLPIVSIFGSDPVESGSVASLGRPGGNITGLSNLTTALEPKRLDLLRELLPRAEKVGVLVNTQRPAAAHQVASLRDAARGVGFEPHVLQAGTDGEISAAFEGIAGLRIAALIVGSDPFFHTVRHKLADLAARHSVPAIYSFREFVEAGGLMSYGADLADAYRQAGYYAGLILKGAKPADLPVVQSTKFELVINLKTAKALDLAIPPTLLARADEVIE